MMKSPQATTSTQIPMEITPLLDLTTTTSSTVAGAEDNPTHGMVIRMKDSFKNANTETIITSKTNKTNNNLNDDDVSSTSSTSTSTSRDRDDHTDFDSDDHDDKLRLSIMGSFAASSTTSALTGFTNAFVAANSTERNHSLVSNSNNNNIKKKATMVISSTFHKLMKLTTKKKKTNKHPDDEKSLFVMPVTTPTIKKNSHNTTEIVLPDDDTLKSIIAEARNNDEDNESFAARCHNMGTECYKSGHYDKAIEWYKICINSQKQQELDEVTAAILAKTHNRIGVLMNWKGEYDGALEHHRNCLAIQEALLGTTNHPQIASTHNDIGLALLQKGDYVESLEHHKICLKTRAEFFGKDHPQTQIAYEGLQLALCGIAICRNNKKRTTTT